MGWKDRLRKGSFRGVEFFTEAVSLSGGRRLVEHVFPGKDLPFYEDLGKAIRGHQLEIYLLGDDYDIQRNRLLAALEKEGSGVLYHPRFGRMLVKIQHFEITETRGEGGFTKFSISFKEDGEVDFPVVSTDPGEKVKDKAEALILAMEADFTSDTDGYRVSDAPSFITSAAQTLTESLGDALNEATRLVRGVEQAKASFFSAVFQLRTKAAALVASPSILAASILDALVKGKEAVDKIEDGLNFFKYFFYFGEDLLAISELTSTRSLQARNRRAILDLVQLASIAEACNFAVDLDFPSLSSAVSERDTILERILEKEEEVTSDDVFQALQDLYSSFAQAIPTEAQQKKRVIQITMPDTIPAFLLSYRQFGSVGKEAEIIAQNEIRHPGFVPGGTLVEVITDA